MPNEAAIIGDGRGESTTISLTELSFIRNRIKELEAENANLMSLVSRCRCPKIEDNSSVLEGKISDNKMPDKNRRKNKRGQDVETTGHFFRRHVALKVMYFGKRFYGFSSEAQLEPSVESEIFEAMARTMLLVGNKKESQYSRCGRTDKGVSAVGQVIALFLRSKLKSADGNSKVVTGEQIEGELDYVRVLNRALPEDIRIIGWCPVSLDFSARFSCSAREYKYFFWRESMNLMAMESAAKKFVGEHDFRSFCKMDAANVHAYKRRVTSFEIYPCHKSYDGNHLYAFKIKGSAFLWHQVRCMVAVLFMIGQGLETMDVIDTLLDIERTPRKPQYTMAPEIPLVLCSSDFEDLKFICSSDARQTLRVHLKNVCQNYEIESAIFNEALLGCLPRTNDQSTISNGKVKRKGSHVPLLLRPTEPSYEERRTKVNAKG